MWYAVVEKATGKLYATSTESVLAEKIPHAYRVIELGDDWTDEGKVWDVQSESFVHWETPEEYVARSFKEAQARAEVAATTALAMPGVNKLTVAQQAALKALLLSYLAPKAVVT
jgi:hypothetical protein